MILAWSQVRPGLLESSLPGVKVSKKVMKSMQIVKTRVIPRKSICGASSPPISACLRKNSLREDSVFGESSLAH